MKVARMPLRIAISLTVALNKTVLSAVIIGSAGPNYLQLAGSVLGIRRLQRDTHAEQSRAHFGDARFQRQMVNESGVLHVRLIAIQSGVQM